MSEYFIGIDLGGTNIKVGLLDNRGHLLARQSQPTQVEAGPVAVVERMARACSDLLGRSNIPPEKLRAAGIGSPGPLSVARGTIINAGNLPGFEGFPIRARISQRLHVPAVLENDANSACWGEFWVGAGKSVTDMIMFTLGTGIGGGIVSAGELLHGSDDNAAELGHMIIEPGGRRCTCGQQGCLEACASASHTARRAEEALASARGSSLSEVVKKNGSLTCKDVFDHAMAGDELANEIVDGTARALGQACVNMRHITEPAVAVFAGGMINAGDFLVERVKRFYEQIMWSLKAEPMRICLASLGEDAGIIGSAGLALHAYERGQLAPVGT